MNRPLIVLLLAVVACHNEAKPGSVATFQHLAQVDVDAGPVLVAAAGDISEAEVGAQVITANLVGDGGYDAVLLLGDDQYPAGALEDYRKYFAPTWGRFSSIIHPTPGNHEYRTPNAQGYFDFFGDKAGERGKGFYSFDLGAWHLVALNSSDGCKTVHCDATSEQVKWLREDLASHRNRCTLAYFHHPRFSSGLRHGNFDGASAIWQALYDYDADLVLNGHEHLYERFDPQDPQGQADPAHGIQEIIIGTGGAAAYEVGIVKANSAVRHNGTNGILHLVLRPGAYDWEFVPATAGEFADKGTGTCH